MDGCSCAMMIGLGETFFPALLIALTNNSISAGMVSTFPLFAASIIQILLFGTKGLFPRHRNFVCTFASLQGLTLLVLSTSLFFGKFSTFFIYLCATLYWSFGQAAGPIWNAWLSNLVPEAKRLNFFARREKWCQVATTLSLLSGGLFLEGFSGQSHNAFALLFLAAALLRFVSAGLLFQHPDLPPEISLARKKTYKESKSKIFINWVRRYKHIFAFLFLIKASVYFGASFFNPYMLKELKLSYLVYTVLLTIALTSRVMIMHFTEGIAKKIGVKYLLAVSTLILGAVPYLWTLSSNPSFLSGLQVLSGSAWACFDFAILIYLMNTIEHHARSKLLVGINFFYALAAVIGSALGGYSIKVLGESADSYHQIFEWSSYFRLSCLVLIPMFFKQKVSISFIATRIVALRPSIGAQIKPVIPRSSVAQLKKQKTKS